jgi:site-specific recombinase XerD
MSTEIVKAEPEIIEAEIVDNFPSEEIRPIDPMDAFEWFLRVEVAKGDASEDTINAYRREVGAWINWCEKNGEDFATANRDLIELYREKLKERGMSVTTRQFKLSIIRRFYDAALRYDLVKLNPAHGVKAGKEIIAAEDKMKVLARRELVKLFDTMPTKTPADARDKAILGLMALHGLRRIEVHRLDHTSLENADSDAPRLRVDGKGSKTRLVYLRPDTFESLQTYFHAKFQIGMKDEGAMFVSHSNNARGKRLSRQALNEIVDKHFEIAGIKREGVGCHALRHTFGTLAVAGGAKIEHLRDAMGHSKIDTTSIYVRAVDKVKNNPANFIDIEL